MRILGFPSSCAHLSDAVLGILLLRPTREALRAQRDGVCTTAIENYLTPVLTFGCSGFKHKFEIRRSMAPTNHDATLEARESL
jgi:hypothetical protein